MAKNNKSWNFEEMRTSALVNQTEEKITEGYNNLKKEQPDKRAATPATDKQTKGVQAEIPIKLYERLILRKLRTRETLGSMFNQALEYWLDAQESRQ